MHHCSWNNEDWSKDCCEISFTWINYILKYSKIEKNAKYFNNSVFIFFISVFIFISIIFYIYNAHTVLYLNLCAIAHEHHFLQTYHMICSTDLQHSPLILIHYISLMSAVLHSVSEETSSSGGRWRDWQIERKRWSKRKWERSAWEQQRCGQACWCWSPHSRQLSWRQHCLLGLASLRDVCVRMCSSVCMCVCVCVLSHCVHNVILLAW